MENTKMVALIGNREIRFSILKEKLDAVRRLYPDAMWISNGTIGADLMIAKYAMRNRIPLFMCIPFPPEIIFESEHKKIDIAYRPPPYLLRTL